MKNVKVNTANPATTNASASPTHAYNYDSAGNRTSSLDNGLTTNYTSNSVNTYTSISGGGILPPSQNPTYDPNGNMLTGPVSPAASSTLTYDRENRLRTITAGTDTVSHTYDALGRLIQTDTSAATDNRERYTWAGWTLLTREIFTGTTATSTHRYTWGLDLSGSMEGAGGVGGLLAIERNVTGNSTWDIRYPHYDANGNIIALSDSSGNVSARYRYDAFGKTLEATDLDNSGWAVHNIHGFSTKPNIATTGLLYYGYRWYDPLTGRWPTRDPIEENGGINLYGFVGNNCIYKFDRLGLAEGKPTEDELKQCALDIETAFANLIKENKYFKEIYDSAGESCQKPTFACECCPTSGDIGVLKDGKVTLCWGAYKASLKDGKLVGTEAHTAIMHEYVHYVDECKRKKGVTTCEELLCTEIRAYSIINFAGRELMLKELVKVSVLESMIGSLQRMGNRLPCASSKEQLET